MQLPAKELMHLEDYLVMEQTCFKDKAGRDKHSSKYNNRLRKGERCSPCFTI